MKKLAVLTLLTALIIPGMFAPPDFTRDCFAAGAGEKQSPPGPGKKMSSSGKTFSRVKHPLLIRKFIRNLSRAQYKINKKMSHFARDIKESRSFASLFIICLLAFVYGVVHALGPGHGKIFAVTYFLSTDADVKKGLMMGNLVALMHSGLTTILVLTPYFFIRKSFYGTDNLSRVMCLVSYGLITTIGIFLFVTRLMGKSGKNGKKTGGKPADRNVLPMALSIGVVPCPGVTILLLFAISLGMVKLGLFMVLFMCLGMAVTISAVGIMTIWLKKGTLELLSKHAKNQIHAVNILELAGSLLIAIIGGSLFIITL